MSPTIGSHAGFSPSFPRVSGDEPEAATALPTTYGFSPRERG